VASEEEIEQTETKQKQRKDNLNNKKSEESADNLMKEKFVMEGTPPTPRIPRKKKQMLKKGNISKFFGSTAKQEKQKPSEAGPSTAGPSTAPVSRGGRKRSKPSYLDDYEEDGEDGEDGEESSGDSSIDDQE